MQRAGQQQASERQQRAGASLVTAGAQRGQLRPDPVQYAAGRSWPTQRSLQSLGLGLACVPV